MYIENLESYNGNKVPNQFYIKKGQKKYFVSYKTTICYINNGVIKINSKWECSKTTTKYLIYFLIEHGNITIYDKKDLIKHIENGNIIIDNRIKI